MMKPKKLRQRRIRLWRKNSKFQIPNSSQGGYIALVSLLVIAATGLTIGLAVSIAGIEEIQISHGVTQATKAKNLANTCVEDGLERLRNSFVSISQYTLSIGSNLCIIDVVVTGGNALINATGTVDIYNQKLVVQVDSNLDVTSWAEN